MKIIFDKVSEKCSKATTLAYSTSFSLGIKFLNPRFHHPIYAIYGFVRLADEIVDSFHDFDKELLMKNLRQDTVMAIEQQISLNPILNCFQKVVHQYHIEWELIDTFIQSMEMDLKETRHNESSYNQYIFGSAEVVGLMCLRVFTEKNYALYNELKPYAMKLGSAFQKVNFLRDFKADYMALGRSYFPSINFEKFSTFEKEKIQSEIEKDFKAALVGIKKLPPSSRRGVYLAYYYYKKLFLRIRRKSAEQVLSHRIRINDVNKVTLMFKSLLRHQLNML